MKQIFVHESTVNKSVSQIPATVLTGTGLKPSVRIRGKNHFDETQNYLKIDFDFRTTARIEN